VLKLDYMKLSTFVSQLNKVGKVLEKRLNYLGVHTVFDLLHYFPFRYEDYSKIATISSLANGQQVTIKGKVELIANRRSPRKRTMITEAVVVDKTGRLKVVWFGQPFIQKTLKVGDLIYLSGKVKDDMFGIQMVGPVFEKIKNEELGDKDTTHTARIVPIYPLTSGITQKQMRFLVDQVIDLSGEVGEWLPEEILGKGDFVSLPTAIRGIHFPSSMEELKEAERRLKFDELYLLQLRAEMIRQSIKKSKAIEVEFREDEIREFVNNLPFELTTDQKVSGWEIFQDMQRNEPMNRLLEGDVGAGKTVVAAMVIFNTVLNGFQSAIMAPTEILAKQHFESLKKLLPDLRIALLTGSGILIWNFDLIETSKKKMRNEFMSLLQDGDLDIVVGTHAVLTDDVVFKNLALVIVDEQHRFGVEQRKKIRDKSGDLGVTPHFLSMTATPIPRSFALTLYGDLDLSIIKTMPAGRKIVKTRLVQPHNRGKAYDFIRDQVKLGRQVFVVCPLIEVKNDEEGIINQGDDRKSVMVEYKKLSENIFPELRVGYLYGKIKSSQKDETMKMFAEGEIDILVSTSVVEVGVNIPNASVMMIEDAERFGLAQLHQFRGRVGRAMHQSFCFLFTESDNFNVMERLAFFEKNNDGFVVAEYDLENRGPGEVYGVSQSGMQQFRLATLKDVELIKLARDMARGVDFEKFSILRERVNEWEGRVHLE